MPRKIFLVLLVSYGPLDFLQHVKAEEKELLQQSIEDLNPAGNGGDKSEKKRNRNNR